MQDIIFVNLANGQFLIANSYLIAFKEFNRFERNQIGFMDAGEFRGRHLFFELGEGLFGPDTRRSAVNKDLIPIGLNITDIVKKYFG